MQFIKTKLLIILLYFFLVLITTLKVEAQRKCYTNEFSERQMANNPHLKFETEILQRNIKRWLKNNAASKKIENIITIPVVFHVLYNTAEQNINETQILSALEVLNEDYRRLNNDANNNWPQAADTNIEFCLANIDLDGNYINGITRTQTDVNAFDYEMDDVFYTNKGGKDIWPNYMNFYICNLDFDRIGLLGYSSFPGETQAALDGIVMDYNVTGRVGSVLSPPYNLGRTTTHEVGHWLGLEHIWGYYGGCNDDDNISDTPTSNANYSGCNTGSSCGSVDMTENYMDYSDDSCMNLFTKGQADLMLANINLYRPYLFNHTKCNDCFSTVNINSKFSSKIEQIKASNIITAENEILSNANIVFDAKIEVSLNIGFCVDASSDFLAITNGCNL